MTLSLSLVLLRVASMEWQWPECHFANMWDVFGVVSDDSLDRLPEQVFQSGVELVYDGTGCV